MLETWNLVLKNKHICSFRKITFLYEDIINFADVPLLKAAVWELC